MSKTADKTATATISAAMRVTVRDAGLTATGKQSKTGVTLKLALVNSDGDKITVTPEVFTAAGALLIAHGYDAVTARISTRVALTGNRLAAEVAALGFQTIGNTVTLEYVALDAVSDAVRAAWESGRSAGASGDVAALVRALEATL